MTETIETITGIIFLLSCWGAAGYLSEELNRYIGGWFLEKMMKTKKIKQKAKRSGF